MKQSCFSFKTSKRRLGTWSKIIYAIKKPGEKNTYNKNGIIKVVEILHHHRVNKKSARKHEEKDYRRRRH